jgi:uncharacterized membrane protein
LISAGDAAPARLDSSCQPHVVLGIEKINAGKSFINFERSGGRFILATMKYQNPLFAFCVVSLWTYCSGCAALQNVSVNKAQTDFADGKYESALEHLSKAQGHADRKPEMAAQIGFLKGLCYDGLDKPEEARASFKSVADDYQKTDCGFMAKELLDCQPLDLGPALEPSATVRDLDKVFGISPQLRRCPVTASAISGDGEVVIGQQVVSPRSRFWTPTTTINIFRSTTVDGARPVGAIQLPPSVPGLSYSGIIRQVLQISTDGSVMAGDIVDTNASLIKGVLAPEHAFRWTRADGMRDLGVQSKYASTDVEALSPNGAVVAGGYILGAGTNSPMGFFRWTERRGFEDLGDFGAPERIVLWHLCGVSDDGEVIVGTFRFRHTQGFHLFRWTQSGGFQDLGALGGLSANALCASADGSAVVAAVEMADQTKHIVRWTQSGETHDLGILAGKSVWATYASEDGSVVVGTARVPRSNLPNPVPFRWTSSAGMQYVCELGPAWDVQLVGANRDCSRLLLNIFYQATYHRGYVIPIDKLSVGLSDPAVASFFYKSFIWHFNAVSK